MLTLFHPQEQHNRCNAGYRCQREQGAIAIWICEQERCGEQRTDHRAAVIHRAVKAVHFSAIGSLCEVGEHRVARRSAYSLADAIDEAQSEYEPPRGRDTDERAGDPGERIAEYDDWFSPAPTI